VGLVVCFRNEADMPRPREQVDLTKMTPKPT
jgi:hypothetical protein